MTLTLDHPRNQRAGDRSPRQPRSSEAGCDIDVFQAGDLSHVRQPIGRIIQLRRPFMLNRSHREMTASISLHLGEPLALIERLSRFMAAPADDQQIWVAGRRYPNVMIRISLVPIERVFDV